MGRHKRRNRQSSQQSFAQVQPTTFPPQVNILTMLLSHCPEISVIDKISNLLTSVSLTSHRLSEVQLLKETISSAIHEIYSESLAVFNLDLQRIICGELHFSDKALFDDGKLLKIALKALLQMDDSKEVYHLTFVQVNWFTDQLIRSIRSLEGCSNSVLMAAVTRAWNVTKAAAQRLNTFLFQLFKTDKTVTDFSCMILNKQILIEKLRKEPLIIALNDTTDDWRDEDPDPDFYEGMSIEQIVSDIEEPRARRARRGKTTDEVLCDEFRFRLENEPEPERRIVVKCSKQWLEKVRLAVVMRAKAAV